MIEKYKVGEGDHIISKGSTLVTNEIWLVIEPEIEILPINITRFDKD